MLNIFKRQQTQQTPRDFPTVDDLPMLSAAAAREALATLREMVSQKQTTHVRQQALADIYPPDDAHPDWRVWLRMTGEWMTLTEMQQEILAANGKEAR